MFERIARKIAKKSTHRRFTHAALVVKNGNILATGFNHDTRHAEVSAIRKVWPKNAKNSTVVSLRFTKTGNLGNSNPCEDCREFLRRAGVSYIIYWTPFSRVYGVEFPIPVNLMEKERL